MITDPSNHDQKLLAPTLEDCEHRYQKLLAATSDYVFSVDLNHGITKTTHGPGCEAVTGYSSSDFAKDSSLWYRIIHNEDRPVVLAKIDQILHDKISTTPLEHRIIHKDGSIRWIRNTTLPRHDELGKLVGYDGLISDITERKAIEHDLKESNLFLDSVVDNIPIAIFIKEATNLRFSRINRYEEKLLGWSRDEMVGRSDYDFFPKEEADFFVAKDREVLSGGQLVDIPGEPIKLKDGTIRILHTKKIPVWDENNRPKYLLGISEDITERKRTDDIIQMRMHLMQFATTHSLEELLQETLDQVEKLTGSLVSFYHFIKDEVKAIVSQAWATRMFEKVCCAEGKATHCPVTEADLCAEVIRERLPVIHNDYAASPHRNGLPNDPNPIIREMAVPIFRNNQIVAILGLGNKPRDYTAADASIVGYLADVAWNIVTQKQAEEALRESEARVRMATDAAGIAVWDWNVKNNVIKWDEKMFAIYGLPPKSGGWVTYQDWADRVAPADLAEQAALLQRTVATGGHSQREFHIVRAFDQATRVILSAEMALVGTDGQTTRIVGMNIDITERKEYEMRLQKANAQLVERGKVLNQLVRHLQTSHRELKETQLQLIQAAKLESLGTLAAGVAHEVKNPLQTILLGLNYLGNRQSQADENVDQVLTDMRDAVNRANNIILDLLSLSANSDFHLVPTAPNDLIERALMLTRNLLISSHITLQRDLSSGLPSVLVDPPKFEQVLINIIINGIQAMTAGGTLTVRSRLVCVDESFAGMPIFRKFKLGENLVVIEVKDTGPGLTETQLLKAFDPFFTTKPVGIGTGLGLSVTKKIVEEHGGDIEIKNAPGGGALVVVVIKA